MMDLDKASDFERSLYDLNLRIEREMPASNLETTIVEAISSARYKLYDLRGEVERLRKIEETARAYLHSFRRLPEGDDEYVALREAVTR